MALSVDSHITTPVAVSGKAPEPYIDVIAPRTIVLPPRRNTGAQTDSVQLSLSAKIHLLKNQGHSNQQIAIVLNVDTAMVANYLGTPSITTVPIASQTAVSAK